MAAPATEIPHPTGPLSQGDAIERLLAKDRAGQIPEPRTAEDLLDERDDDGAVDIEAADAEPAEDIDPEAGYGDEGDEQPAASADPVVKFDDGTELALSEVKRGYLRQQDYTRKTQEAAELRKSVEAERATYLAEKKAAADNLEPLIQAAIAIVQNPAQQAELEQLRQLDPGAYAVRMMEMQQRQAQIQQLQWQQAQLRQSAEREEAEKFAAERKQTAERSRATLIESIPAFKKDFNAEYQALGKYVLEQGIPAENWDNEVDHRVITLAWKAMQYDRATRKAPTTGNQLRKAPQPMRPGAAKAPGHAQARALREATERAAKSGSMEDAIALQRLKLGAR